MYLYLYCPVCPHSCTGAVPVLVHRACVVGDRASPTLPYTIGAFPFSVPIFLGSCLMMSNVTLRGVMVQIVSITGVH